MSRTVLIVDDEPDIREVARMSLEAVAGWEVLTASGGRAGIEQALERRPDVMLLDAMMPDLDGPSTLSELREQLSPEELPVIMLTAKARGLGPERLGEVGAQGLIPKPFDPMRLHTQVEALLGWDG